MTNYIQAEAEKPRHVHEHSPEGFGLSRDGIRARFADYCSDFEI